jgi:glycosyltransferase involved in cell wall biosynthesis
MECMGNRRHNVEGPRVSVVLPVYDRQEAAERAVESVLAQSFGDVELIIVDDGSAEPFRLPEAHRADGRIRLIRKEVNRGPAAARNAGAAAARGDWIAWIDSDDRWHPDKLANQARVIAGIPRSAVAAVATGFRYTGESETVRIPIPATAPDLFFAGCWYCPGTTTVVSQEAFARVGGYDESLRRFEDVDWFIRFGRAGGQLHVVDEVLAEIHRSPAPPLGPTTLAAQALIGKVERTVGRGELRRLKAFLHLALAASAWQERRFLTFAAELARSIVLQPRLRLQLADFWPPVEKGR